MRINFDYFINDTYYDEGHVDECSLLFSGLSLYGSYSGLDQGGGMRANSSNSSYTFQNVDVSSCSTIELLGVSISTSATYVSASFSMVVKSGSTTIGTLSRSGTIDVSSYEKVSIEFKFTVADIRTPATTNGGWADGNATAIITGVVFS